jgi:hypothetical protein
MASEDTPLLVSDAELAHEALYNRFSPSRKRTIVALVSCSAILPSKKHTVYFRANSVLNLYSVRQRLVHPFNTSNCGGSKLHRSYRQVPRLFPRK